MLPLLVLCCLMMKSEVGWGQTVVVNPTSPWIVPAGVTSIKVEVWGGGGAGGEEAAAAVVLIILLLGQLQVDKAIQLLSVQVGLVLQEMMEIMEQLRLLQVLPVQ